MASHFKGELAGRCKKILMEEALCFLDQWEFQIDGRKYAYLLKECGSFETYSLGKQVHAHLLRSGLESSLMIDQHLVEMYRKCASLTDAERVFDRMPVQTAFSWTSMISACVQQADCKKAIRLFEELCLNGRRHDEITMINVLNAAANLGFLSKAKVIHAFIVQSEFGSFLIIQNGLISMYSNCGSLDDACRSFNTMITRDTISWNTMIVAFSDHGHDRGSLQVFRQMYAIQAPSKITFLALLTSCSKLAALPEGKLVHAHILDTGLVLNAVLGTAIVSMYGKCGSTPDARKIFDAMQARDIVSWNSMMGAYVQDGNGKDTIYLFQKLQLEGINPDKVTITTALAGCSSLGSLMEGRLVHASIPKILFQSDPILSTSLVDMYGKCGSLPDAQAVFDELPKSAIAAPWNVLIAAYAQQGYPRNSFLLFETMQLESVVQDKITFINLLDACSNSTMLSQGFLIHAHIIKHEFRSDLVLENALVNMYNKCGSLRDACIVFRNMNTWDIITWNSLIMTHVQHGHARQAIQLYYTMYTENIRPDKFTFMCIVDACIHVKAIGEGVQVHEQIAYYGLETDVFVGTALVNMYGRFGYVQDARIVFNKLLHTDIISWNVMISVYAYNCYDEEALQLFQDMHLIGITPNRSTFLAMLDACASTCNLAQGVLIHKQITEHGYSSELVMGTAILTMYNKCGSLENAEKVFQKMHDKDIITWNAMGTAYIQHGHTDDTLKLFYEMFKDHIMRDVETVAHMPDLCTEQAILSENSFIHACSLGEQPESVKYMGNMIINMYGKQGSLNSACRVFYEMPEHDAVSWNNIVAAYSQHGKCINALLFLKQMYVEGVELDAVTFLNIFSGCSHAGLVDVGFHYFSLMEGDYRIVPVAEHNHSMIDIIGRAGQLDEAADYINNMPIHVDGSSWVVFIAACKIHGDLESGKWAAGHVLGIEDNVQNHVWNPAISQT